MRRICKYPLELKDYQLIEMPKDATVLSVQTTYAPVGSTTKETPTLWVEVDDEKPLTVRRFRIFGTGQSMTCEHELRYIGTCLMMNQALTWHVYENYIKEIQ
jgi:hypothetical protein